jgi:hypothetical protein
VVDSARPICQTGLIPVQSRAGVQGWVGTLACSCRAGHPPVCYLTPSAGAAVFHLPAPARVLVPATAGARTSHIARDH